MIYALVIVLVTAMTAVGTKPSNVGLDWIPLYMLTLPLSRLTNPLYAAGIYVVLLAVLALLLRRYGASGRLPGPEQR